MRASTSKKSGPAQEYLCPAAWDHQPREAYAGAEGCASCPELGFLLLMHSRAKT